MNSPVRASLTPLRGPVVIVDDDASDALHTEEVIHELRPKFPVQILTSGDDLIAYLQAEGLYQDRSQYPYPGLILLDLKMPKMDGFEVLQWVRNQPRHTKTLVVVLSGWTDLVQHVARAYQLGANAFLSKPVPARDIESIFSLLKVSV